MKMTLTLDEDVIKELRDEAQRIGQSFEEVVNATLRRGLRSDKPSPQLPRFKVEPKACGFQSDVDVLRLNQL